jgi:hypothetical protein
VIGPLLALAGCAGGATSAASPDLAPLPPLATSLDYQDPAGSGWRLLRDASSTPTRIVLNLVGPAGLKTRGAGFNLQGPAGLHFTTFDESNFPIRDTGVYELLNSQPLHGPDPLEPTLLAGGVKAGNLLTVGLFQKDRRVTAKDSGSPLCQIAFELDAASPPRAGDGLPLVVTKSKYMAEDIGAFSGDPTPEMIAKAHLVEMNLAVGTVHAH